MEPSLEIKRPSFAPQEFRGYALSTAALLDSACPGFLIRLLYARSNLIRQAFFSAAAEFDLQRPDIFLAQIAERAPDVLAGHEHLDPLAQIGRALILLKPKRAIEVLFGACPHGLAGAFSRFGGNPLYPPGLYKLTFDLFSSPASRQRAKVLGQMEGRLSPQHIQVVAALDDVLLHRAVVARVKLAEVQALNTFAGMIMDLCDASPPAIRASLNALPVAGIGGNMSHWVRGWIARQIRLPVAPPISENDPDFKVCIGQHLRDLGRRYKNCAGSRTAYAFVGERVLVEWLRTGQSAVIELALMRSGSEQRWECTQLVGPKNRRVKPDVLTAVRQRF